MKKILTASHLKTKKNPLNRWLVRAHRAESTDLKTARSGFTAKIPPWFKYEELIDDWLDLTVLEETKRGPALENRLVGDTELCKGLLNRESLRAADGVKYFRDTLRPHFKRAQSEILWRLCQNHSSENRTCRDGQVDCS